jgi:uncharacterized protein DUF4412
MKYAIAVLICLTISAAVFADAKIVQTINSSGIMGHPPKNDTMTIYVKGQKARIDMGAGAATPYQIIDVTAQKAFIVDPGKKSVMVMTADQMKKTAGMLSQLSGSKKQAPPTIKKLGTSKTYNGYKCDEYSISMSSPIQTNGTYCISSELDLRKDLEPLSGFSEEFARMFGADIMKQINGYPVHSDSTVSIMGQTIKSSGDLVSISHDSQPESLFVVPADFKVMEMPAMPKMPNQ